MVTVDEATRAAAEQQGVADLKKKMADAKPTLDMFQHIMGTQATKTGFTVTLIDGTSYRTPTADFMFTDGMSIVDDGHRVYIPKTSIRSILIHNPGEKFQD